MTRIICVASLVYFKIRFFFEIYYHENSNFPFAAGLVITAMFIDSQGDKLSNRFLSTFLPYTGRVQNGGSIEFTKSYDGHFYIQAQVNDHNITFLLDTGATDIVLSQKDALHAGINLQNIRPDANQGIKFRI
ncbi:TIGR02281 family clan AA aspartic protease [Wolbachia pipientis]|nr:TIGR02281 family clan AA aspartic protease [Wolbachia pipientis]